MESYLGYMTKIEINSLWINKRMTELDKKLEANIKSTRSRFENNFGNFFKNIQSN